MKKRHLQSKTVNPLILIKERSLAINMNSNNEINRHFMVDKRLTTTKAIMMGETL